MFRSRHRSRLAKMKRLVDACTPYLTAIAEVRGKDKLTADDVRDALASVGAEAGSERTLHDILERYHDAHPVPA